MAVSCSESAMSVSKTSYLKYTPRRTTGWRRVRVGDELTLHLVATQSMPATTEQPTRPTTTDLSGRCRTSSSINAVIESHNSRVEENGHLLGCPT
jgi:hypothetical protein